MKIMVIDGNSIINRAFYGVRLLSTREGLYTNAVYGFLNTYFKVFEEEKPDGACVCFDLPDQTFRHIEFGLYKAGRHEMPNELAMQLPLLKDALMLLGISIFELSGFEADDLIGTISRITSEEGHECVILTGDRDTLQLIDKNVRVRLVSTKSGESISTNYDEGYFCKVFEGLTPEKIVDLKGLSGDKSDNIPGVRGIGDKTALDLIKNFGSIAGVYENISSDIIKDSVKRKLDEGRESAFLSRRLAEIDKNAPINFKTSDASYKKRDDRGLYEFFSRLEMKSLIKKLELSSDTAGPITAGFEEYEAEHIKSTEKLFELLEEFAEKEAVSVFFSPSLLTGALCDGNKTYTFSACDHEDYWPKFLKDLFSEKVKKVMHDAKPVILELLKEGLCPSGLVFDTAVGAYLVNPDEGGHTLEKCVLSYFNTELKQIKAYNNEISLIPADDDFSALSQRASAVYYLYLSLKELVFKAGMEKLYYKIESPLIYTLAYMQKDGFKVDKKRLVSFGKKLEERIDALTKRIYKAAGGEININSTKQLGALLFETLSLPVIRKTKTGYSTDIDVLVRLRNQHEIIDDIIEYRKLTKLKSTYADGLEKVISSDGRIHSTFNQTATATGRLSSTEPNLQNIPIRQETGSEIRRSFIAEDGFVLIDADYSQIELRILAHIAEDETMLKAFSRGEDIHTVTASQIFGVLENGVTAEMRRAAKAVNFGIVYGISDFSLSEDIGVTRKEAGIYINNYLERYSGVKRYMEEIKKKAREDGYVSTLFGRRRYLPQLKSSNFNIRSFGERAALNTPIQGTAADIIKIAMVSVHERLKREKLKARLILQVHDELIVESCLDEAEYIKNLLKEEMEGAATLLVPLTVDISMGENWYEAKR